VIVLDTNVVSELARPRPAPEVIDWVDAQNAADLVITAVTAAEIRAGVALLPNWPTPATDRRTHGIADYRDFCRIRLGVRRGFL
jgi:predicted nucleic acid-binding protein